MSRPHILVVDDEPFNLEIIAEYLCDCDYVLDTVGSGEQALDRLGGPASAYDLVVLDRMMPGIDGMAVLRQMKQTERLRPIPVIMQTAAATPDQVREGLAAGAHYYLTKPFEAESLIAVVRTALDDRARRAELSERIASHAVALQLLESASFTVRTLDQAAALAATAALVCPNPEAVAMGLAELLVNGVEHGNLGITFEEKGRLKESGTWADEVARRLDDPVLGARQVRLDLTREDGHWCFRVLDEGAGFDWQRFIELDPARAFAPNGRGIVLARQIAFTSVEYRGRGNEVLARVATGAAA